MISIGNDCIRAREEVRNSSPWWTVSYKTHCPVPAVLTDMVTTRGSLINADIRDVRKNTAKYKSSLHCALCCLSLVLSSPCRETVFGNKHCFSARLPTFSYVGQKRTPKYTARGQACRVVCLKWQLNEDKTPGQHADPKTENKVIMWSSKMLSFWLPRQKTHSLMTYVSVQQDSHISMVYYSKLTQDFCLYFHMKTDLSSQTGGKRHSQQTLPLCLPFLCRNSLSRGLAVVMALW